MCLRQSVGTAREANDSLARGPRSHLIPPVVLVSLASSDSVVLDNCPADLLRFCNSALYYMEQLSPLRDSDLTPHRSIRAS